MSDTAAATDQQGTVNGAPVAPAPLNIFRQLPTKVLVEELAERITRGDLIDGTVADLVRQTLSGLAADTLIAALLAHTGFKGLVAWLPTALDPNLCVYRYAGLEPAGVLQVAGTVQGALQQQLAPPRVELTIEDEDPEGGGITKEAIKKLGDG